MPISRRPLALAAALLLAACAHRPPPPPYDRAIGVEAFDAAWRIVHETHFDTTFGGVDWVALRDSLRPRVEGAGSTADLRGAIAAMLGRLGASHFTLIPAERADALDPARGPAARGTTGLDVRLLGGQVVVTRVDSGSGAERAGVRPGWVLLAVGRERTEAALRRLRERPGRFRLETALWAETNARLAPPPGSAVTVVLRDGADRERRVRLVSGEEASEPVKMGNLPTVFARFAHQRLPLADGGCAGVTRFNAWVVPLMGRIDAAVDADRACAGMVIDLRGNPGGVAAMLAGVAGHFLDRPDTLGVMRTRRETLAFVANPRRVSPAALPVRPFAGPLAILVDEGSASTSEAFAGGMQALGRARVFGRTSMGAVLTAAFDRLPNGDVLYHAVGVFVLPDGRLLEGRGVTPDDSVTATRADLLAGRDPVLDAAVRWIAGRANGARP